ncbi:MAG: glycosyltransferase [Bauldia sp.]|nr:glycosyltransferase [Bauldia sp.]
MPLVRSLVRGVWARLPVTLRRSAIHGAIALMRPPLPSVSRDRVHDRSVPRIVVGYLSAASGLGQSARLTAAALRSEGFEVLGIDIGRYFYDSDATVEHGLPDGRAHEGPGHAIVVVNGPYLPYALTLLGRRVLREKWVTAYWAWELDRLPANWKGGFACAHDIAVPSAFVAAAVRRTSAALPVVVAPHPVACDPLPPSPFAIGQRRPEGPFTIATMANLSSNFARKNPVGLIAAYRLAFGGDRGVRLRMRLTGGSAAQRAAVVAAIGDCDTIAVEWRAGDRDDLRAWFGTPDVYAALHRAEGFGLPLAEAMLAGYPVVATGWSGNMEFMTPDASFPVGYRLTAVDDPEMRYSGPGAEWAEPDVEETAGILQWLHNDPELVRSVAGKARDAAGRVLGARAFVERLTGNERPARAAAG